MKCLECGLPMAREPVPGCLFHAAYAERAAIKQFSGRMDKDIAEKQAYAEECARHAAAWSKPGKNQ